MRLRKRLGRILARRRFRGNLAIAGHNLKFGGHVAGAIDDCRDGTVKGWVYDARRPSDVIALEVLLDGAVAASGQASVFREDLGALLGDDGLHGFEIEVDDLLVPSEGKTLVSVRLADKPDYVIGPFEVLPEAAPPPVAVRVEAGAPGPAALIYDLPESSFSGIGRFARTQLPDAVEEKIFRARLEEAIWRKKTQLPIG